MEQTVNFSILLIGTLIVIYFCFFFKKKNNYLKEISKDIGGVLDANLVKKTFKEICFQIVVTKGVTGGQYSYSSPSDLTIETSINSNFQFTMVKETFFDKFKLLIGCETEFKTGDKIFDKKYLIKVNDASTAEIFFNHTYIRESIDKLFTSGFTVLVSNGQSIQLSIIPFQFTPKRDAKIINEAFPDLLNIIQKI